MNRSLWFVLVAGLVAGVVAYFSLFDSPDVVSPSGQPERLGSDPSERTEPAPVGPSNLADARRNEETVDPADSAIRPQPAPTEDHANRRGRIVGRVIDSESRQPLRDARVVLSRDDGTRQETAADAAGSFEFDDLVADEPCEIEVSAVEHSSRRTTVRAAPLDSDPDAVVFRLELARSLRGRVTDEHGVGVPARLQIRRGARQFMVECDENGAFAVLAVLKQLGLSNRPPEKVAHIWVRSNDHKDAFVQLHRDTIESGSPLEIRVETGASVSGRCVAPGDTPLIGVEVTCYPLDESSFAGMRTARTDSSGRFRIGGLRAGRHQIEAQASFDDLAPNPKAVTCQLSDREALEITPFTYSDGSPIRGRVIARLDEAPLTDRIVTLHHHDWLEPIVTLTDHEGRFVFGPLGPGDYRVVLRGESWFDDSEPQVADAEAGTVDLLFVVDEPLRDGTLRMVLRDATSGSLLPDTDVVLRLFFADDDDGRPFLREGRSDADGAFVLTRLPQARFRGRIRAGDFAISKVEFEIDAPAQTVALEVSLRRTVTVRGRIVDLAGNPISGASVAGVPRDDLDTAFDPRSGILTGDDGEFVLTGVDPDSTWICAYFDGLAPGRVSIDPAGRDVFDVRIELSPGTTISGTVRHENGVPARRFLVEYTGEIASQQAATDDRGQFEFVAVEAGAFSIRDADGFVLDSGFVTGEAFELSIVIPDD